MNKGIRLKRFFSICLSLTFVLVVAAQVFAGDSWISEFDEICGKTQDAEALGKDELKKLVSRCDALKPVIEGSDNSRKKVYLFRLEKCRKLFQYVLDAAEDKK